MLGNQTGYLNVNEIQAAFNHARRMEESQFCLPTNSILNLNMPSQSIWDNMNSDQRFLFLTNAERTARAGLNYCEGEGPVSGLAFTGVEANVDQIAQTHAELLINTQSIDYSSQASNIDENSNIGGSACNGSKGFNPNCCHTFVPYSVYRIYFTSMDTPANPSTITTPGIEARSVYYCVYGNGSLGNGRKMLLLQDIQPGGTASNPCGFNDDYGDDGEEGFLGVGIAGGVPHPSFNRTHIDIVILSYFDPVPEVNECNYDCTTCVPCLSALSENSNPIPTGSYKAINSIQSAGVVNEIGTVNYQAGNQIELKPSFEVMTGGNFHAIIESCYFSL